MLATFSKFPLKPLTLQKGKMKEFQVQTPQRDTQSTIRRPRSSPEIHKNLRNVTITKKSSKPEIESALEEESELFPDVPDDDQHGESAEDKQVIITKSSDPKCEDPEVDSVIRVESIEAEVVINHLKETLKLVSQSKELGPSRKLLDAMINIIIEEFHGGLYDENDWLGKFMSSKAAVILPWFMLGISTILVIWHFLLGTKGRFTGPPPT